LSLEAIIFDVDGTLAETEEVHRAAFNRAFNDANLPWHWDQDLYGVLLRVTGGKERIRHFIDAHGMHDLGAQPDAAIAQLHAAKTLHYARLVDAGAMQLRPGFQTLIEDARRAGVRLAIATTTSLPNVESLLQAALGEQGRGFFEVIAAGDIVPNKKPAPDIYLSALAQLSVAPSACVAVEDSRNGLRAALASGIDTLVVRSSYSRDEDFAGAALVVDSLEDVPARFGTSSILNALRALHAGAHEQRNN
jgi:HAD superfamily hydrolase (TIGR01509 family)